MLNLNRMLKEMKKAIIFLFNNEEVGIPFSFSRTSIINQLFLNMGIAGKMVLVRGRKYRRRKTMSLKVSMGNFIN